jgi:hypothetical protein
MAKDCPKKRKETANKVSHKERKSKYKHRASLAAAKEANDSSDYEEKAFVASINPSKRWYDDVDAPIDLVFWYLHLIGIAHMLIGLSTGSPTLLLLPLCILVGAVGMNLWLRWSGGKKVSYSQRRHRALAVSTRTVGDTGATAHMFDQHANWVESTLRPYKAVVTAAGGTELNAVKRGTVRLVVQGEEGKRQVLQLRNALLVPDMGFNLVSIPQLDKEGYTVSQERGKMHIKKDGRVVATGHLREGLYQLGFSGHSATLASAHQEPGLTEVDLLHRRLGHASGVYLSKYLKTKGNPKLSYCDACTMGKAGKLPYRKRPLTQHEDKTRAMRFLSTVVGDLCGKLRIKSLSGTSYFAVLVDLASRYVWVLFLRKKGEFQA